MKKIVLLGFICLLLSGCNGIAKHSEVIETSETQSISEAPFEQAFKRDKLKTNTALRDIDLDQVLGGGPGKDGIPAIHDPTFISVDEASEWLEDHSLGILYQYEDVTRFYPYDVLYWHEIVNDSIDDHHFSVTFCPLCGSAITFDRMVGDNLIKFGVSGKLWQSNLLMYDDLTESLWSQSEGRAVVGDMLGTELEILDSDLVDFENVKKNFADAKILSKKTGYIRSYGRNPYGTYEEEADIFFPVNEFSSDFHPKTLFYIVNQNETSVGFHRLNLMEADSATINIGNRSFTATATDEGLIKVYDQDKNLIPGYTEMWFSWQINESKDKHVWALPREEE